MIFAGRDILRKASDESGINEALFAQVDEKLKDIMESIYFHMSTAAKDYHSEDNFVVGANIAGFLKVADAMMSQGIV